MEPMNERINQLCSGFEKRLKLQGIYIPKQGILAGREKLENSLPYWDESVSAGWDNAHFPFPFALVLELGLKGIENRARLEKCGLSSEEDARREGIAKVYSLLIKHIILHAELAEQMALENPTDADRLNHIAKNLRIISENPPQTFEQGVQLVWFLWRTRQYNHTSCIGRMDVFLRPLYEKSVMDEVSRNAAFLVLRELWEKVNATGSGDTLMNVMLGGVDQDGIDISCDLSLLIMEVTMAVAKSEPHINVRLHKGTPDVFRHMAERLILMGQGQGVIYNDEYIIPSLVKHGVPIDLARCYANDGCTEITIEGKSGIQFWQFEMVKTLELFLFRGKENPSRPHKPVRKWNRNWNVDYFQSQLEFGYDSGNFIHAQSFEQVFDCFLRQLHHQIDHFLSRIDRKINEDKETDKTLTSLLVCGGIPNSLDEGKDLFRGGFSVNNYQLLSGSIPTAADSLAAIQEIVFIQKKCSMSELLEAISNDFENQEELRQILLKAPKFGNGDNRADDIAARIAEEFCNHVDEHIAPHNVRIWPGMYNIDFIMFASILGATPDGRHAGDAICEHYSPTPGRAKNGPTAVLRSAARADLARGCAASPVYIALPVGNAGKSSEVIGDLIDGIQSLKLPLVSIVLYDRNILEDAIIHPELHEDLVVRVWGYNARFIDLDEPLQHHIMNRIL